MKTFLVAIIVFSTLFIFGFANQREKLSKPDAVEAAIFGKAKFARYDNKYVLVYPDNQGRPKLIYDPDILMAYPVGQANPIDRIVAEVRGKKITFSPSTPIQIIDFTSPIVASAAGSMALGVSAKELLTSPSLRVALRDASKDKRIVIGLLASVTGYGLGVFAADRLYLPSPDSPEASKLVGDSARWYKNHLRLFALAVLNAEAELQTISDDATRTKAIEALNAATRVTVERLNQTSDKDRLPRIRSGDVEYMVQSLAPFQAEVSKAMQVTASWNQIIAGLLWLPLVVLAGALLLVAGMAGWDYYSDRKRNAFPTITH